MDARLARFVETRNARDLWPDVSVTAFRAAEQEVARVATAALGDVPGPVALRCPPGTGVRALGVAAFAGGMGALVGHWCETGRVFAEPAVGALFAVHLDHGRRRAARLREGLDRLLVPLAERGIEVFVLKGMHTGHSYFAEPGARTMADVDLLVQPGDWQATREVLGALGFVDVPVPGHPEQSTWTARGAGPVRSLELTHAESPWSFDLHRSLDRAPFEGLRTNLGSPAPADGDVWSEFCRPVRVLRQPLQLAYLAVHASSHFYSIMQVRLVELILVARSDFAGRPDRWRALDQFVARTGTGRFVFPALDLAERLVPGTIDPLVLGHVAAAAPRRLRRLVRTTTPASAQQLHPFPGLRERFVWVASLKEALAALAWLVRPRRGETQWRRMRRAVRRIVRARLPR
jgi:putative nucleotidyltransferase-like protein